MTNRTPHDQSFSANLPRRRFLGMSAAAAGAITAPSLLAGCGGSDAGSGSGGGAAGPASAGAIDELIPTYAPLEFVEPDFPSVDGSTPGYLAFPEQWPASVEETPGHGSSFTAMVPLWAVIPPGLSSNTYMQRINEEVGARFEFQITDGNTYGEKLQAVLASPDNIPDYVTVLSSAMPARFDQAVERLFTDLTPYLSGDNAAAYPNLANLPSDAWRCCVFNGKLYGLPYPSDVINSVLFYRHDILSGLDVQVAPTDAEEFLALAEDVTDPSQNRWACNDIWNGVELMYAVPPRWRLEDGHLVHRFETEEFRAALEYQARLFEAGVVHPDAVAGNVQQARQRFISGEVVFNADGAGGWLSATRDASPSNPDYNQQAVPAFAADGGQPVIYKGTPSNLFTFLKRTDDTARIEEMLALANYFAAPFGTEEQMLLEYGYEGVHYERDDLGVPVFNEKGLTEVKRTYTWITRPPNVASQVQYPSYVEDFCTWMADVMPYATEPLFHTQQVPEPPEYGPISQPMEDLINDIARGRRSLNDLDGAVENWRASGGDRIRDYYADYLEGEQE